ncbi:MAG: CDP-archaeol synthase [Methylococcaceae bacterium]|nr:CDP-archaeol synthase [Methylococcaceae bacterium]MCI0732778.1 CDP-archaeol synthase [Methylococcaceae bacterium]
MEDFPVCLNCIGQAVILVITANGAPVIAGDLLKNRFDRPVDMGRTWKDGRALFGKSKTWRGLVAAVTATMLAAPFLGLSFCTGGLFGWWVMAGDLSGSFMKRRRGLVESSRARLLDIIPESLLPGLVMHRQLGLGPIELACVVGLFFLLEVFLSPILYRWGIRKRPY